MWPRPQATREHDQGLSGIIVKLPGDPPPLILLRLSDPASVEAQILIQVRVLDRDSGLAPNAREDLHISVGEVLQFADTE